MVKKNKENMNECIDFAKLYLIEKKKKMMHKESGSKNPKEIIKEFLADENLRKIFMNSELKK